MRKSNALSVVAMSALVLGLMALPALGGHNPAVVDIETITCGETTFTASVTNPEGTHLVGNMRLVVHVEGGDTQFTDVIPTNGDSVLITVGPFFEPFVETITIMWRVFGGGERSYDSPPWNGFGETGFNEDVGTYGAENGFSWVVAGPDDPNPFTTWNELDVEPCVLTKEMCKDGGWEELGFSNQGQCISFVNTGQDSR